MTEDGPKHADHTSMSDTLPALPIFEKSVHTTSDELDNSQSKSVRAVNFADDVNAADPQHIDRAASMHAARQLLTTKLKGIKHTKAASHSDRERVEEAGIQGILFPWHKSYKIWWAITVGATIVTAVFCPYAVAFEPRMGPFTGYTTGAATIEFLLTGIFFLDIFVSFRRAFHKGDALIFEHREIAKHYCLKLFWVDFLAVFPFSTVALAIAGDIGKDTNHALLLSLLQLLQLLRVYRMQRFFHHLQYNAHVSLIYFTLLRNGTSKKSLEVLDHLSLDSIYWNKQQLFCVDLTHPAVVLPSVHHKAWRFSLSAILRRAHSTISRA